MVHPQVSDSPRGPERLGAQPVDNNTPAFWRDRTLPREIENLSKTRSPSDIMSVASRELETAVDKAPA
jgi:hypothetical protein